MEILGRLGILAATFFLGAPMVACAQTETPGVGPESVPVAPASESALDTPVEPTTIFSNVDQFGGPTSVAGQLAEDNAVGPSYRLQQLQDVFEPWFESKSELYEETGLQFSVDESLLYQVATQSPGESNGASGLFRVFGQWELVDLGSDCGSSCPGLLVFKAEHRHEIGTELTPFDLGFAAGSITPTGTFFSEFTLSVTNLFWKQYFFDNRLAVAAGRIDVTDFIDVYAMMNPLTHFINLSFSTNPSIAVPNQGLGVAAGGMLTEHLYLQGGFSDANGQPTLAGFDTFFGDNEYFSYAEIGLTTAQDRLYLDNVHVTFWHTDSREAAGTPHGHGVTFSAAKFVDDRWLPFVRAGFSDGDAALLQTVYSAGLGYYFDDTGDVAGVGVSWGDPADGSLRAWQFTTELFYRFQMTQFLAITPDVQIVSNPALNPGVDTLAFFGIRARAAF